MSETFPRLETTQLVLRELQPHDAEALFRVLSDQEVTRYYDSSPLISVDEARQRIERHHRRFEQGEAIRWGITLKGEDVVIGNCGLSYDSPNRSARLAYVLARSHWRRGIMTEALRAVLRFGFEVKHLHRIEAEVAVENVASCRTLLKLGFREEGTLRERQLVNQHFCDEKMFSLLSREYNRQ